MERVRFFSRYDMSIGNDLEMAEKTILAYQEGNTSFDNINDILELMHIKRFFDEDCRLVRWTDEEYEKLKITALKLSPIVAKYFNQLESEEILVLYSKVEWDYRQTFWDAINQFQLFRLIDNNILKTLIDDDINVLRSVLLCSSCVDKYKVILREILLTHRLAAQVLIDKYVSKDDNPSARETYLPNNLILEDKENIIERYLDGDGSTLNNVRLIIQTRNSQQFALSPRVRLKAKRLEKKLNDELMQDNRTVITHFNLCVQFVEREGMKPMEHSCDKENRQTYSYSRSYIGSCDNVHRIFIFFELFGWLNEYGLVALVAKNMEMDGLEAVLMNKGRDSYPNGQIFERKNNRALCQTLGYERTLASLDSSIEKEMKQFYEKYLREAYAYPSLKLNIPNIDDQWLNKCRILFPELDAIVKQYDTYVGEDEIDIELLQLAKPLKMTEGRSLLTNKYYAIKDGDNEIWQILRRLFASGNMLDYVAPYKNKHYCSLVALLEHESVQYSNYKEHQKRDLNYLIEQGLLCVDKQGKLLIVNVAWIKVLKSLWEYHVCSYWHYDADGRKVLDDMLAKGWLEIDGHLLSKSERKYFSYYLDNELFSNGYAYRNHYAHGSALPVDNENEHTKSYLIFLRLLLILLLKIEDDLRMACRVLGLMVMKDESNKSNLS